MLAECKDGNRYTASLTSQLVSEMQDGGMRGLNFRSDKSSRVLGQELTSIEFEDVDGVKVFATINLDQDGELFELDIWKADFSAVLRLPN
jgi:hypothetical protein